MYGLRSGIPNMRQWPSDFRSVYVLSLWMSPCASDGASCVPARLLNVVSCVSDRPVSCSTALHAILADVPVDSAAVLYAICAGIVLAFYSF
jgi:hypothetical protein